jgi:hypothetical protein
MAKHVFVTVIAVLLLSVGVHSTEYNYQEIVDTISSQILTCTTTARLENVELKYHLHSHPINYGSGSGQQAVSFLIPTFIGDCVKK